MLLSADPIFGVSTTKVTEMRQFNLTISVRPSVCRHKKLNAFFKKYCGEIFIKLFYNFELWLKLDKNNGHLA